MNARLATLGGALIVVAVLTSVLSATIHRDFSHTNDFILVFPLELLAVVVAGVMTWRHLQARGDRASAFLGVGVYLLVVAVAISTAFPSWLPSDNTILGSAVLAGLLAAVGAALTLASSAAVAAWSKPTSATVSMSAAALTLLAVTGGGVAAPLQQFQLPLLVALLVVVTGVLIAGQARGTLLRPMVAATIGSVVTVALLLARGSDDWASASSSLKLYSLPIVLMAAGVSLVILAASDQSVATG